LNEEARAIGSAGSAAAAAADVEVEVEVINATTLDDRQTMGRIHYKAQRWTDNTVKPLVLAGNFFKVKFEPSSWRETFSN